MMLAFLRLFVCFMVLNGLFSNAAILCLFVCFGVLDGLLSEAGHSSFVRLL